MRLLNLIRLNYDPAGISMMVGREYDGKSTGALRFFLTEEDEIVNEIDQGTTQLLMAAYKRELWQPAMRLMVDNSGLFDDEEDSMEPVKIVRKLSFGHGHFDYHLFAADSGVLHFYKSKPLNMLTDEDDGPLLNPIPEEEFEVGLRDFKGTWNGISPREIYDLPRAHESPLVVDGELRLGTGAFPSVDDLLAMLDGEGPLLALPE